MKLACRGGLFIALLFLFCQLAFAGGPLHVAGVSGFQNGLAGTPITWADGQIYYYTDQGDLSPLLPNAAADQFVAEAFARWTSVSTAALLAERTGSLDEDVDGSNVTLVGKILTLPDDIKPESSKPLAIVYDADGRVIDALMGPGAGVPELCTTNSIYAQPDRFSDDAHIAHALIVINGNCATTASQLAILKYRLVRALGHVLGLDYSQLNDNVVFGPSSPGADDYAGFPVMHPLPALCTETDCQPNADVLRMDDRAAISRLYPVTSANISGYSGKTIFKDSTGRIFGSVRFPVQQGLPGQGMQGVNVVARMVDPVSGQVSRLYAGSSVSGFLFRGNAGNPITGYGVPGKRLDMWGSTDLALEGYFDIAGLEIPSGYDSATYELSVEAVNPLYVDSTSVGPYHAFQVTPSGNAAPIRLTVTRGGEVAQDINMAGATAEAQDQYEPSSFLSPSPVPAGGDWLGSLSGYGDMDYMSFTAQANRTFTFDVTILDTNGLPTTSKAQPVLGMWAWNDPEDMPHTWQTVFNSAQTGTIRLQAEFMSAGDYRLGIVDYHGDGRPDYRYRAHLLYADNVVPERMSVLGGAATVNGIGFSNDVQVMVNYAPVSATPVNANQISIQVPPLPDRICDIIVTDPHTGASSAMQWVLRVGSMDTRIVLLGGSNPQVPVGTQAPNPFRVQVLDIYTGEPVNGATVNFSVPATAAIVGCERTTCPIISDQNGIASVYVMVKAEGPSVIQASLPTGGSTSVTINGIAATLEIVLDHPTLYLASGASATIPVAATVVANGIAVPGRTVNFLLNTGSATFSPASSQTNASGVAITAVTVTKLASDVNISACVDPGNAPCRTLIIHSVPASGWNVQRISGDQQVIHVGENFAPVTLKVADVNGNPVNGATVGVLMTVFRATSEIARAVTGEVVTFTQEDPVVLRSSAFSVVADANGMITIPISVSEMEPVKVAVQAWAGRSDVALTLSSVWNPNGQPITPSMKQNASSALKASASLLGNRTQMAIPIIAPPIFAIESPVPDVVENQPDTSSDDTSDKTEKKKDSDKECRSEKEKNCRGPADPNESPKAE